MKNKKIRRERNIEFTVHHRVTFRDAYSDETRDCTNQSPTRIDWTGLKHGNKTLGFDEWFKLQVLDDGQYVIVRNRKLENVFTGQVHLSALKKDHIG